MNQFTKKTGPSKDGVGEALADTPRLAWPIIQMGLIIIFLFVAFWGRVHLNDKTEQLAREKERISEQIREKRTEIQRLNLQLANLRSWKNIDANIKKYNLALRAANPSQIRQVKRVDGTAAMPSLYGNDTRVADYSSTTAASSSGEIR